MISVLGNSELIIHHSSYINIYAVTSEQLELLKQNTSSEWKGYIQTAISVLTTTIINIMAIGFDVNNASFRMNIGLGFFSLLAAAISTKFYIAAKQKQEDKVKKILSQPVQKLKTEEGEL